MTGICLYLQPCPVHTLLSIKNNSKQGIKILLRTLASLFLLGEHFEKENKHPIPVRLSTGKRQDSSDAGGSFSRSEGGQGPLEPGEGQPGSVGACGVTSGWACFPLCDWGLGSYLVSQKS